MFERGRIGEKRKGRNKVYIWRSRDSRHFIRSFSLPVSNQNSHNSISLLFQLTPISFPRSQNLSLSLKSFFTFFPSRKKLEKEKKKLIHSFPSFPIQLLVLKKLKVTGHKSLQFKHTRKGIGIRIEKKEISPSIKCLSIGREGFFCSKKSSSFLWEQEGNGFGKHNGMNRIRERKKEWIRVRGRGMKGIRRGSDWTGREKSEQDGNYKGVCLVERKREREGIRMMMEEYQ